jgi:cation diffusion facilitator family transporter
MNRDRIIVRTSIIGIAANVLLAAFKAVVGTLTNSIAITLDAVNNLSDALSSVITIIGTKLAGKAPDKKHPMGYGRIEYMSAMIIALIVLYAGITSFIESVKKIITPEKANYAVVPLIIVAVAVVVKVILGRYVKSVGVKVNSDSLINSGQDAVLDSVISASTLLAAAIYLIFHISLEAWLGAVISIVIIKSGIDMLRETLSRVLGERVDAQLTKDIKKAISMVDGVKGVYDLVLHDYGPDRYLGSVHIELPDYCTTDEIDTLTREINELVYERFHIIMTAVGVYSLNTRNDEAAKMRERIRRFVMKEDYVLQMHGFYVDFKEKYSSFDVVIDYAADDRKRVFSAITDGVQQMYPDFTFRIAMDSDFSD